jgi:hypothetical protein
MGVSMTSFLELTEPGDIVVYRNFMGALLTVQVSDVLSDIKNGRAGFDGRIVGADTEAVWGYGYQVVRIHKADGSAVYSSPINGKFTENTRKSL